MSRFFNSGFQDIVPYVPGEQPRDKKYIKLNTNESPFPPSPLVAKAINTAQIEDLRLYSDPTAQAFLTALAENFGVSQNNVIAGNGSDELLAFCFQAFCQKGAAFPDVTYGFYKVFAKLYGVSYQEIPLEESWSISPHRYAGLNATLFIANPNAPTGDFLPLEAIEQLLQNKNRLVIIDEAYIDFGGKSAAVLLPQYDNLLVIGTFSKSRSLAGARIGYAIGNEKLIGDLNKIKFSFNPYNLNRLSLLAGTAALADTPYFDSCREQIIATRILVEGELKNRGFTVLPSHANFLFVKHPALSGEAFYQAMKQKGFLVRYLAGKRTEQYVRITIGTRKQMELFLQAVFS